MKDTSSNVVRRSRCARRRGLNLVPLAIVMGSACGAIGFALIFPHDAKPKKEPALTALTPPGTTLMASDDENIRSHAGGQLYSLNCANCHGDTGEGKPMQGADLRKSPLLSQLDDKQLLKFIKQGRPADAPDSIMKRAMPPLGGNPTLTDAEVADIIAYLRELQLKGGADSHGGYADVRGPQANAQ